MTGLSPRGAAALALALLLVAGSCTAGDDGASSPTSGGHTSTAPSAPSWEPTTVDLGTEGWQVQAASIDPSPGSAVSTPGYAAEGWLSARPDDGGGPGTLIGVLLQNGFCPDVFVSTNLDDCRNGPGGAEGGDPAIPPFDVPWWFRTEFTEDGAPEGHRELVVNGVIGEADLWVNGTQVADGTTLTGAFTRVTFDITGLLHEGTNGVALLVAPNDPSTMFTMTNVDWTQRPPDDNAGIRNPVQLHRSGPIRLDEAYVHQRYEPDLDQGDITAIATLTNTTPVARTATVDVWVSAPDGTTIAALGRDVEIEPGATTTVRFEPGEHESLHLDDPEVWWPAELGGQPLYRLTTAVRDRDTGGATATTTATADGAAMPSDWATSTFGIRSVTSSLVGAGDLTSDGVISYEVNGVPLLVRGAGWSEDLFLRYSRDRMAREVALVRDLGLNTIRVEGHEMPDDFYQRMDEAGILVDAGFQCCMGAWERGPDDPPYTPSQRETFDRSARTIGRRLRNHPSVFTYGWSDLAPTAEQEAIALAAFTHTEFEVPVVASGQYRSSPQLGVSGKRMGPYNWVPPVYWFDTERGASASPDPTLGSMGSGWGFVSESSAGHTVPTLDSLRRFLSEEELTALWQDPDALQYHASPTERYASLRYLDAAIANRYGQWTSLEQYVQFAQTQNYEDVRAQFEAFVANSTRQPTPATGLVYWQLTKGWPTLLWSLYNNDLDLPGSYFGALTANRPVHVLLTEDDDEVVVANHTGERLEGLTVESRVLDLDGRVLDAQTVDDVAVDAPGVRRGVLTPMLPDTGTDAPRTSFVELTLRRGGELVDRNVYWRSSAPDLVDWAQTVGAGTAVMARYADLRDLQTLPPATLEVRAAIEPGHDGDRRVTVEIANPPGDGPVSFFVRADMRRCRDGVPLGGDDQVRGTRWDANLVTLWPGQSQTLQATFPASGAADDEVCATVGGWNVPVVVTRTA